MTSPEVEGNGDGEIKSGTTFTSARADVAAEAGRQGDELWAQEQRAAAAGQNGARP